MNNSVLQESFLISNNTSFANWGNNFANSDPRMSTGGGGFQQFSGPQNPNQFANQSGFTSFDQMNNFQTQQSFRNNNAMPAQNQNQFFAGGGNRQSVQRPNQNMNMDFGDFNSFQRSNLHGGPGGADNSFSNFSNNFQSNMPPGNMSSQMMPQQNMPPQQNSMNSQFQNMNIDPFKEMNMQFNTPKSSNPNSMNNNMSSMNNNMSSMNNNMNNNMNNMGNMNTLNTINSQNNNNMNNMNTTNNMSNINNMSMNMNNPNQSFATNVNQNSGNMNMNQMNNMSNQQNFNQPSNMSQNQNMSMNNFSQNPSSFSGMNQMNQTPQGAGGFNQNRKPTGNPFVIFLVF